MLIIEAVLGSESYRETTGCETVISVRCAGKSATASNEKDGAKMVAGRVLRTKISAMIVFAATFRLNKPRANVRSNFD